MKDAAVLPIVFLIIFMATFVSMSVSSIRIKNAIADGELACERIHGEVVCWNPKEAKQ